MLQRYTAHACRCASTSTATSPCRHSLPTIVVRSHSKSAPSSATAHVERELERPFNYTAPLWRAAQPAADHWFGALRPGWTGWHHREPSPTTTSSIEYSRPDHPPERPPPPPALADMPATPTGAVDDAMASRLAAYFAARGPRSTLSQFRDEFGDYLAVAARCDLPLVKAMVLEDAMLEDLTGNRRRRWLEMERFSTTEDKWEGGKLGRVVETGRARPAVADVRVERDEERAPRRREGEEREVALPLDTGELAAASETVDAAREASLEEDLDAASAAVLLREYAAGHAAPTSSEQVALAWDTFSDEADLAESSSDLELALSLLVRLAEPPSASASASATTSPSSASAAPADLPLALRVLDSLLDVFSDDVVAPNPTLASSSPSPSPSPSTDAPPLDLPPDARLQLVLLRTAATIALSDAYLAPAVRALEALARVRAAHHPALEGSPENQLDDEMLEGALARAIEGLRDQRHETYRPSRLGRGEAGAQGESFVEMANALLRVAAQWSPARPTPTSPSSTSLSPSTSRSTSARPASVVPRALAPVLAAFADELAHRYRWDLLAAHWATWSARGWIMPRWHLRLARWLAGDAPYSTYPLDAASSSSSSSTATATAAALALPPAFSQRSTRTVRPSEFAHLALATSAHLHRGLVGRDWTSDERNEWLDLLCTSSAATPRTCTAARRCALAWHAAAPPTTNSSSAAGPFVLRAGTLLALVRTALPPHVKGAGTRARTEATYLVRAHLAALANRASPYASAEGEIAHFDLTTLAQAYGLLGDTASAAQVFRRLLEQKTVPDRKDVETVLVAQATASPDKALELVGTAARFGIKVDVDMLEAVLRALLEVVVKRARGALPAPTPSPSSSDSVVVAPESAADKAQHTWHERNKVLKDMLDIANELGLAPDDRRRLARYAHDFLPLRKLANAPPGAAPLPKHLAPFIAATVPLSDSPAAALNQLRAAHAQADYGAAARVLRRAVERLGLREERALMLALGACDRAFARAARAREGQNAKVREEVRAAARGMIDLALAPVPTLVETQRGLDAVLEWVRKVGDVEAVEALMALMDEQAEAGGQGEPVRPSDKVVDKTVRWAVVQVGKEELLEREGWLGDAARRILVKR
ncbi:hypothetical protein JCM8208_006086 [Rhodotorula glutinis]